LPDISLERIREALACVMPDPHVVELSARTGQGIETWVEWLRDREPSVVPVAGSAARAQGVV
jgi:Ni2+-binding GTPase involved in maturation of urease and hydrogenase